MKIYAKLSVILLSLIICTSFCSCGKKAAEEAETPVATKAADIKEEKTEETDKETKETDKETEKKASGEEVKKASESEKEAEKPQNDEKEKFFWCMEDGNINIMYHTKECELIKGKKTAEVDFEMAKTIGLRQCEECKPPKYEGYAE